MRILTIRKNICNAYPINFRFSYRISLLLFSLPIGCSNGIVDKNLFEGLVFDNSTIGNTGEGTST